MQKETKQCGMFALAPLAYTAEGPIQYFQK